MDPEDDPQSTYRGYAIVDGATGYIKTWYSGSSYLTLTRLGIRYDNQWNATNLLYDIAYGYHIDCGQFSLSSHTSKAGSAIPYWGEYGGYVIGAHLLADEE